MQEPLLRVPARPDVLNLFPDFKETEPGFGVIKHDIGATLMLRHLGFEVQSPVRLHYDFPHPPGKPPFEVQIQTVERLTENKRFYVLSGMGVGKTACAIWAFDYLRRLGLAKKMLVVAPLSTLKFTWMREFFDFCPHLKVAVLHGTKAQRLKVLATDADVYIINHDGPLTIAEALKTRKDITNLVLDELAVYRNPTDRSKWMQEYAQHIEWVWGMTGAPTPHEPTDVYGQAKIVTPNRVPMRFGRFREQLMYRVSQFIWVPRKDANEQAFNVLQPSVRFQLEDVTELPPYVSIRPDVDLGPKQKLIYEALRKDAYAMVGNQTITAVNAGAALNKLLQVSLGWVYDSDGNVIQLDNKPRLKLLGELIEGATGKVIVFSAFKHALSGIEQFITKDLKYSCAVVSGDTPMGKRSQIFHQFQNELHPRVLDAHPQCMAHGITLTAADTVLWFGPITSNEIYDQANMRIRRVGQKRKQLFGHIQATPAERRVYNLLIGQQNMQAQLLDMFRED